MVELTPDILNQTYARHMGWYPAINNPDNGSKFIYGLADIIDQFDLILLDSYGVLCRGNTPVEGALDAIALMRESSKSFCVVSNDTMTNKAVAAEKYQKRGFDFNSNEVLTSLDITDAFLETIKQPERYGVIAPLEHPSNERLVGMVRLNGCNGEIPEQVDTLLFLTGAGWTAKMQESLVKSGQGRQFELVVGNPDIGAPNDQHIVATPGYFMADFVERSEQTAKPILFGKPDASIFTEALRSTTKVEPSRVLMVGDTLYTDILGGNAMGFQTLLLQCGVYKGQDIVKEIQKAGIVPDYIAPNL